MIFLFDIRPSAPTRWTCAGDKASPAFHACISVDNQVWFAPNRLYCLAWLSCLTTIWAQLGSHGEPTFRPRSHICSASYLAIWRVFMKSNAHGFAGSVASSLPNTLANWRMVHWLKVLNVLTCCLIFSALSLLKDTIMYSESIRNPRNSICLVGTRALFLPDIVNPNSINTEIATRLPSCRSVSDWLQSSVSSK